MWQFWTFLGATMLGVAGLSIMGQDTEPISEPDTKKDEPKEITETIEFNKEDNSTFNTD